MRRPWRPWRHEKEDGWEEVEAGGKEEEEEGGRECQVLSW
jgi:hypothetical protein